MRMPRLLTLAILSSILLAMSLPNDIFTWGNPAIGIIALLPLYVAIFNAPSYRSAYVLGAVFGGLSHALASYWLWFFKDFRIWTLGSTTLAYMLVYGFLGMYLCGAIRRGGIGRSIVFAMVWAVFEWGKSSGFLAYPWGLLAYSFNTVPLATQIVESTGVYGLSFAIAFISSSLGVLVVSTWPGRRVYPIQSGLGSGSGKETWVLMIGPLVVSVLLFLSVLAYGSVSLERERVPRAFFSAVLVQQNEDPWEGTESESLSTSINLTRDAITSAGTQPDIVLFSESTLRRPWIGFSHFYEATPKDYSMMSFIRDSGACLLTGAPDILSYDPLEASNSVILIDSSGTQLGSYAKIHPVPFAEAIPFWEYEGFRRFIQDVVGLESGWVMGSQRVIFDLPTKTAGTVRFGAPICFEDAFAPLCRSFIVGGADLLINLSNDSWSRRESAQIQHLALARFRAIELRRTLVRSTNGGYSAVIGPDGAILDSLPMFEARAQMVSVPVYSGEMSPYLRYGDWFSVVLACILAGIGIILFIKDAFLKKEDQA